MEKMPLSTDFGLKGFMINIREERKNDHEAIKEVNDKAFNRPQEGVVVNKIRKSGAKVLSLVATIENKIVGHILFSTVEIKGHEKRMVGMGLAPMAVLPKYQKQGIGSMLIKEGVKRLKKRSVPFVIVLGHENYYPKFGFEKASKYGLRCQWKDVPDEAFMVLILDNDVMKNIHGIAKYREEFNEAM